MNEDGYVKSSGVYAWSDDYGKTFHSADGSFLAIPLTINPSPKHNANICRKFAQLW